MTPTAHTNEVPTTLTEDNNTTKTAQSCSRYSILEASIQTLQRATRFQQKQRSILGNEMATDASARNQTNCTLILSSILNMFECLHYIQVLLMLAFERTCTPSVSTGMSWRTAV
jgi:hypothetical protein